MGKGRISAKAFSGDLQAVKKMVEAKQELVFEFDREGFTALHTAAIGGHFEIVKYLVESGADVNAIGVRGCGALHSAIMSSGVKPKVRLNIVEFLLESGANPNHKANFAGDLITTAKYYRRSDKIKQLLRSAQKKKPRKHK